MIDYDLISGMDPNLELPCPFCGLRFKRQSSLDAHVDATHKKRRIYRCSVCTYSTDHLSHFRNHARTHEYSDLIVDRALESIPNYCPICRKFFKYDHALTEHRALVHEDRMPYSCDICGTEFKRLLNYKQHMERHEIRGRVACPVCGLLFDTQKDATNHARSVHKKENKCPTCGAVFARLSTLKEHIKIHEADRDARRVFTCPVDGCGSKFTKKSNLTTHMETIHGGVQPHVCPICGKDFRFPSLLELHMQRHEVGETEIIEVTEDMLMDETEQGSLVRDISDAANK